VKEIDFDDTSFPEKFIINKERISYPYPEYQEDTEEKKIRTVS